LGPPSGPGEMGDFWPPLGAACCVLRPAWLLAPRAGRAVLSGPFGGRCRPRVLRRATRGRGALKGAAPLGPPSGPGEMAGRFLAAPRRRVLRYKECMAARLRKIPKKAAFTSCSTGSYHTASSCAPRLRRPVRPRFRGRLRRPRRLKRRRRFGLLRLLAPPPPSPRG
jgi:hypothetical protein